MGPVVSEQIIIEHLRLAFEELILFFDQPALFLDQTSLLLNESLLLLDERFLTRNHGRSGFQSAVGICRRFGGMTLAIAVMSSVAVTAPIAVNVPIAVVLNARHFVFDVIAIVIIRAVRIVSTLCH